MNLIENQMLDLLNDLKENHGVIGLKTEFEAEGSTFEEAQRLKELALNIGLEYTIKIGGCCALNDMHEAKKLEVDNIVAPMIESVYAAEKFISAANRVFTDKTKIFINIETKNALDCANEIISKDIYGIVLGRTDLTCSYGALSDDVNNENILKISQNISEIAKENNKEFTIGGGVSALSIPFFEQIPYLQKFETRKIIFDAKIALSNRTEEAILKAVDFELMWLKNNRENYSEYFFEDDDRIKVLKNRFSV